MNAKKEYTPQIGLINKTFELTKSCIIKDKLKTCGLDVHITNNNVYLSFEDVTYIIKRNLKKSTKSEN